MRAQVLQVATHRQNQPRNHPIGARRIRANETTAIPSSEAHRTTSTLAFTVSIETECIRQSKGMQAALRAGSGVIMVPEREERGGAQPGQRPDQQPTGDDPTPLAHFDYGVRVALAVCVLAALMTSAWCASSWSGCSRRGNGGAGSPSAVPDSMTR